MHEHLGQGPHLLGMLFSSMTMLGVLLVAAAAGWYLWRLRHELPGRRHPAAVTAAPEASSHQVKAREILAERLARGEIDTEEYRERMIALET